MPPRKLREYTENNPFFERFRGRISYVSKQGLKELLLPTLDDAHIKKSEHSSINTSKFSSRVLRDMSNEVMIYVKSRTKEKRYHVQKTYYNAPNSINEFLLPVVTEVKNYYGLSKMGKMKKLELPKLNNKMLGIDKNRGSGQDELCRPMKLLYVVDQLRIGHSVEL